MARGKVKKKTTFEKKPTPGTYRREALRAAKDFGYPSSVIKAIKEATTVEQISLILQRARKAYL